MVQIARSLLRHKVVVLGLLVFVLVLGNASSAGAYQDGSGAGWYGPYSDGCYYFSDGFEWTAYSCSSDLGAGWSGPYSDGCYYQAIGSVWTGRDCTAPMQKARLIATLTVVNGELQAQGNDSFIIPGYDGCAVNPIICSGAPELTSGSAAPWTRPPCYDTEHYYYGGIC
jgi:hypothetical protein